MCRMLSLLLFVTLSVNFTNSWDIAITNGDQLEFYTNGTRTKSESSERFRELTALAYDAVHNILLFVDKESDNASIFSYHIPTKKYQPLVKRKAYENIQGLAFDPVSSKLFWVDYYSRSIFWISLGAGKKNDIYGTLLIKMDDELPRDIAVDSCGGYIYWSNVNVTKPTIERARLDGTDRKIIIDKDMRMPVSLTIDDQTRTLYWVDDREGIHYSVESSDLEGTAKSRKTLLTHTLHQPNKMTVSKDSLYWVDWGYHAVWRFPKEGGSESNLESLFEFDFRNPLPFDIVANYQIEDPSKVATECKKLAVMALNSTARNESFSNMSIKDVLRGELGDGNSSCAPSFRHRCEVNLCHNYCLTGDCMLTNEGQPICSCKPGFHGARCEVDHCLKFCLNDGVCSFDLEKKSPQCKCTSVYEGDRCEVQKAIMHRRESTMGLNNTEDIRSTESAPPKSSSVAPETLQPSQSVEEGCNAWDPIRDPIIMVLGVLTGVLCVACAVLVTRVLHLKKRPRIKKRIIVSKNVTPLTARPDQCEITIENCCNMNICETPCFEPRTTIRPTLLEAKPGKEEKRNLIANMEQPDDY